jgi:hypothetical protein
MKLILDQLARSGVLPDDEMSASILSGILPPVEEIALALVISCMDAEATVRNDLTATWNDRRIARALLLVAFLSAIACVKEREITQ